MKKRWIELEEHIHQEACDQLAETKPGKPLDDMIVGRVVENVLAEQQEILPADERKKLISDVINRITGLGPIEPFLKDPEITEVMVNAPDEIFIEKEGTLMPVEAHFRDEIQIRQVIDRIIAPLGRRVDESVPYVDARLPDGSRVNAVIPPLSIRGPALTIRRFAQIPFDLARLASYGTISQSMASFLRASVRSRLNLVISGGTGSGKTSTLNALLKCIPDSERLVTIEDTAELKVDSSNYVSLESRPPNIEGEGEVTIQSLVRNALRMRPDRIIVGEVRGAEAFDMLQAMNTGHPGSLTTVHANSPGDALRRIESMVLMAGLELPQPAIREQVGRAVDLIIQQERRPDGSRKVTSISEVILIPGESWEGLRVETRDIFLYQPFPAGGEKYRSGVHRSVGYQPACLRKMALTE